MSEERDRGSPADEARIPGPFPVGVARPRFFRTLEPWKLHFTSKQEAQLKQIATNAGTDGERLVKDAALRLLEGEAGFRAVPPGIVVAGMRALRARV
jgi:hypothetical protein